jgi:histidyl-tRNA synthetase
MADLPAEIRDSSSVREVQELFTLLERAGIKNLTFDITLMRGLDYYTGMVFEVYDTHPENNRSLFGGGRYDGLVSAFGVEPISAVGVAPGGTTMENFLSVHELLPKLLSTTDVYVATLGDTAKEATKLAHELRSKGINVELDLSDRKLDKQLKNVLKKAIPYMIFVGEDEVKAGKYALKDVINSKDFKLDFAGIVDQILG